jgi:type I restriction enzyme R subunit
MKEKFTRRKLPHWDQPGATYFITTCLEGSIPAQGLLDIQRFREGLEHKPMPEGLAPGQWKVNKWKQAFACVDKWLDRSPAVRHLQGERLAIEVVNALKHFNTVRYELIAWVVMPSHVHWVFRPLAEWTARLGADVDVRSPRQRIQHSINRYTARECNRLLRRTGGFWQRESYDHCVRDEDELDRIVTYIHSNPVKAGLVDRSEDFPFSSAREYAKLEGRID